MFLNSAGWANHI